jgi:anti-sigma B factor antagonist/stage II sporulation protein AA (anti-sigma F factor antagonist)
VHIASRHIDRTTVAEPAGRIDHLSAAAFEAALDPLLAQAGSGALVLDLSGVDYISSVGLRALMLAARRMQQGQGRLLVTGLQSVVAEIFKISRFDRILDIAPTLAVALARARGDNAASAA